MSDQPAELRPESRPRTGLPPFDVAAEEAVIAALLLDDGALDQVSPLLTPADFFREQNAWCYEAALAVAGRGETVTVPSLAHELDRSGRLDDAGGEPYLAGLAGRYFTAIGVEAHARIVARDATYRRLIEAATRIAQLAYAGGPDVDAALQQAQRLVEGVESAATAAAWVDIGTAAAQMREAPEALRVTTGLRSLDRILGGLAMGQISVVGARTDHGKTSLLVAMALGQAARDVRVAYLPLEGSRDMVVVKATDHLCGTSWDYGEKVGWGASSPADWRAAAERLEVLPVWVPDRGVTATDIESLRSLVATAARRHDAQVIYIDHIDALPITRERGQPDASVVSGWMRDLQSLAARLDVHLVVASQVNREGDKDTAVVPRMFYLKESSAKEQAAQNVVMLGLEPDVQGGRRALQAYVEKVKGYPFGRWVVDETGVAPLYLDVRSGAVRESIGFPVAAPPAERAQQPELVP